MGGRIWTVFTPRYVDGPTDSGSGSGSEILSMSVNTCSSLSVAFTVRGEPTALVERSAPWNQAEGHPRSQYQYFVAITHSPLAEATVFSNRGEPLPIRVLTHLGSRAVVPDVFSHRPAIM